MTNDQSEAPFTALSDAEFKQALAAALPQLRAFARSLCGCYEYADDLVQETMLKTWAARERFQAGTNFRAWAFTILRNHFLSVARRNRFHGDWDDGVAERVLAAPASQDMQVQLADVLRALQELPVGQREAIVLVGAGGYSYEEVADICGVAVGTIKSRVARGRASLEAIVESGILAAPRSKTKNGANSVVDIMMYVETLRASHPGFVPHLLAA